MQNTILKSVMEFVEAGGFGTEGENIFAFRAPDSKQRDDKLWVITPVGGSKDWTNVTGEDIKTYLFEVTYRSRNSRDLDRVLFEFDKYITGAKCVQLKDFATMDIGIVASLGNVYIDPEQRWVGETTISAKVYDILK